MATETAGLTIPVAAAVVAAPAGAAQDSARESLAGGPVTGNASVLADNSDRSFVLRARYLTIKQRLVLTILSVSSIVPLVWNAWYPLHDSADAPMHMAGLLVVFVAALISSIAGFAFAALSGAALAHLYDDPVRAVEVMVVCSIAIQSYSVLALRRDIDWGSLVPFLLGGLPAVPLGVWLLTQVSPIGFALALGAFLVSYGVYSLLRPSDIQVRGHVLLDVTIGALGGIVGGLAAFPGAFITIWCGMRGWTKTQQRATYQPYILVLQLMALACLRTTTTVHGAWSQLALHVPVVLLAAYIGLALFKKLTHRQFTLVVYGLLVVSGLSLLAKGL